MRPPPPQQHHEGPGNWQPRQGESSTPAWNGQPEYGSSFLTDMHGGMPTYSFPVLPNGCSDQPTQHHAQEIVRYAPVQPMPGLPNTTALNAQLLPLHTLDGETPTYPFLGLPNAQPGNTAGAAAPSNRCSDTRHALEQQPTPGLLPLYTLDGQPPTAAAPAQLY